MIFEQRMSNCGEVYKGHFQKWWEVVQIVKH